ncbi:Ankyrin-R-like protein [Cladobotryum mycophilum]|uniref:Ankyrin-R-like protein n=1 Tax=Cladobotryum mycophilum TaxID=491253 RepID=A0ABR0S885_9HYPO
MAVETRTHDDYSVGWVCALSKEQTAATAMLDEMHDDLPKPGRDTNAYTLGSIGKHNIVIACLPDGEIGTSSAANVVTQMVNTFPFIKFGLMVGIGGGIPPEVRLGDVVVSKPVGLLSGVVQWDLGKATQGGKFERTGSLNRPPKALLTALTKLRTSHEMKGPKIRQYLDNVEKDWPRLAPRYTRSDTLSDPLLEPENPQHSGDGALEDRWALVPVDSRVAQGQRQTRETGVHYGLIASGNQVIKDSTTRDRVNEDLGGNILCIEMEAAGLMNNFPCLVIRGICDYADSTKKKDWQEYAAAVAAAFAKELLGFVQPSDVEGETPAKDILKQVHRDILATREDVTHIKSRVDKSETRTVLNWITPLDYGPQQSDTIKRRQPGTGEWLLELDQFQNWLATSKHTLFCPGIPGAGKTILTSIVIDYLDSKFQSDPTIGIAYIYCNFRRHDEQKFDDLLASVLKQLAESQPSGSLPISTRELYNQHAVKRTRPSLEQIKKELQAVTKVFSRVFIIVDALDECQSSCCKKLLLELFKLQKNHGINIFATSRFIPEIVDQFKTRSESLEIRATKSDVISYLEGHLEGLAASVQRDQELQKEITTGIAGTVNGMFLLAQIYFNLLRDKTTKNDIRNTLTLFQNQSQGQGNDEKDQVLSSAYKQTMERISQQREGLKGLAMKVLLWITHAKRALNTSEIQHALATKTGQHDHDHGNLSDLGDIVAVCAGLVTVDEQSGIIRLVHYTTQKYLEQTHDYWFPGAESDILTTCIAYLSFDAFGTGSCEANEEFKKRQIIYPLYNYAASNWGHHIRKDSEPSPELMTFLENQGKVESSSQPLMPAKNYSLHAYHSHAPKHVTGLHLAGYFGIDKAVNTLLQQGHDPNLRDSCKRTPLWWASRNGHDAVVRLLLDSGAKAEAMDTEYGTTSLCWAARNGNETIVQLLLDSGANVNSSDEGGTPLLLAVRNGHEAVVNLLLKNNASAKVTDRVDRRTPLSWAAGDGKQAIVQLLLDNGTDIDVNAKDKGNRTVLSWAASSGNEAVIQLLLTKGAKIDEDDLPGKTKLIAAVSDRQNVLRLLSRKDPSSVVTDTVVQTSSKRETEAATETLPQNPAAEFKTVGVEKMVQSALKNGAVSIFKTLFEKLVAEVKDPNFDHEKLTLDIKNKLEGFNQVMTGETVDVVTTDDRLVPFLEATKSGSKSVAAMRFSELVDTEANDKDGGTPLPDTSNKKPDSIVDLLLEQGASIVASANTEAKNTTVDLTPFLRATMMGYKALEKHFVEARADCDAMAKQSLTPLIMASYEGQEAVVKSILGEGIANIEAQDASQNTTPLMQACYEGQEDMVKLHLEAGADIEAQDAQQGRTPLMMASYRGHEAIVKVLIEAGANVDARGINDGLNALMLTSFQGNLVIAKLLLHAGADVNAKGTNSAPTSLACAIAQGHSAVVRLLLENGADVNMRTTSGVGAPLDIAVTIGNEAVIELLLEAGADINAKSTKGLTPLSTAAAIGLEPVVQLLLRRGADINIKNEYGQVSLFFAAKAGNKAIVQILLTTGKADVNAMDVHGQTALSVAAYSGDEGTVRLLLENGAYEAEDRYGRTPIEMAHQKGHNKIKQILIDAKTLREIEDREHMEVD